MGYDNDARRRNVTSGRKFVRKARLPPPLPGLRTAFLFFAIASDGKKPSRPAIRAPKRPPLVNYIIRNREFAWRVERARCNFVLPSMSLHP